MNTREFSQMVAEDFDNNLLLRNGILAIADFPRPVILSYANTNVLTQAEVSKFFGTMLLNDFKSPYLERERNIVAYNYLKNRIDHILNGEALIEEGFLNTDYLRKKWINSPFFYSVNMEMLKNLSEAVYHSNSAFVAFWMLNSTEEQNDFFYNIVDIEADSEQDLISFINQQVSYSSHLYKKAIYEYEQQVYQYNLKSNDKVELLLPSQVKIARLAQKRVQSCGVILPDIFEMIMGNNL